MMVTEHRRWGNHDDHDSVHIEFYRDTTGWHWVRMTLKRKTHGQPSAAFKTFEDCRDDARKHGLVLHGDRS